MAVSPTTLVLLRHSEAAGDDGEDPGLTPRGREQTAAAAAALRTLRPAVVRHGPRRRARETAEAVGVALGVSTVEDERLDDLTPVPSDDRLGDYDAMQLRWLRSVPATERDPDAVRLRAAWRTLRHEPGPPQVLVTHAFVVAAFVADELGAAPSAWMRMPVPNAAISVLEGDPRTGLMLQRFADVSHLL